jgi:hypothetical protein
MVFGISIGKPGMEFVLLITILIIVFLEHRIIHVH